MGNLTFIHLGFRATRAIYYLIQEVTAASLPGPRRKAVLDPRWLPLELDKHGPREDILVIV